MAKSPAPSMSHASPAAGFPHRSDPAGTPEIARFIIEARISPAFEGRSFGSAGQYEVIVGRVHGSLDPHGAENARIVELDKALIGDDGRVGYSTQVAVLRPLDMARCSGNLVYEVLNRGNGMIDISGRSTEGELSMVDMLLDRGDVIVAAAWQGELAPPVAAPVIDPMLVGKTYTGTTMYADLPKAMEGGKPLVRRIRQEHSLYDAIGMKSVDALALVYPAAADPDITVYTRRHESDEAIEVPTSHVRLVDSKTVAIDPIPGAMLYDILYNATGAVVSGIGLAVPRDLISFLRNDPGDDDQRVNPLLDATGRPAIRHAIAYGISQSGRFLRFFLWQGFNADSRGRQVFDGVVPVVSGGKKGFFNGLFAKPAVIPGGQEGHRDPNLFPFAYPILTDPLSGKTDGILMRCLETDTCPKIIHIDTETETVEGFGWMLTTGPDGQPIAHQPENLRLYEIAGADHGRGGWRRGQPFCGPKLASPVPVMPFVRALMIAMGEWVARGIEPPASRYPSLVNGTLVTMAEAQGLWPVVPHWPFNTVRNQPEYWLDDTPLPNSRGKYPLLTPQADADGNAIAGIRHPMFAVPTGTMVGFTPRAEGFGPEDICPLQGEIVAFAATRDERVKSGDMRLSLEERYPGGTAELTARRAEIARQLAGEGLLRPEDVKQAAAGSIDEALAALRDLA